MMYRLHKLFYVIIIWKYLLLGDWKRVSDNSVTMNRGEIFFVGKRFRMYNAMQQMIYKLQQNVIEN